MAETKDGRKFNRIPGYTRQTDKGPVEVRPHIRSNPKTSTGKEPGKGSGKGN